jgi:hypothetical protein
MAIASVLQMVHDRLPFTAPIANDDVIERTRIQMTYLMQPQTEKSDSGVETESNYTPLQNMLFAAMVAYQLVKSQTMLILAGNGTTSTGGAKIITKAKADVVEADFEIPKAIDGAMLGMATNDWLSLLLDEICKMGWSLGYRVPWCDIMQDVIPPFIVTGCQPLPPLCCYGQNIFDTPTGIGY